MANVIDVSASGKPEAAVLTGTASSSLLGGIYLHTRPLEEYLGDAENPHYVVRNKHSGLRIEHGQWDTESTPAESSGDGSPPSEKLTPTSQYQALAVVTDVRLVFVVGRPGGDRSTSVALSEVDLVSVEDGLLGSELSIVTASDDRYVFPCRGDLDPVEAFIDQGAQAWTRAYSLLDAAREELRRAERALDEAAFEAAIDEIDAAVGDIEDARRRIAEFGDGAATALEPESNELAETITKRRREIRVEQGIHAQERARSHWGNREYEQAHEDYRLAIRALESAQDLVATKGIEDRLDRIDDELEELADAPLSYARTMVEEARASDDDRTAAQCWAVAIERYRDVYALDWARERERFNGDPAAIRNRILDALDRLVEHRVSAAEDLLADVWWLRDSGDDTDAHARLLQTREQLEHTAALVDELSTAEYPELVEVRDSVAAELSTLSVEHSSIDS